jgi:lysyl-tRNA synthetase class 2
LSALLSPGEAPEGESGEGQPLAFGGRAVRDGQRWWIADALGRLEIELAPGVAIEPGDLLQAEGRLRGGRLAAEHVSVLHRPSTEARPGAPEADLATGRRARLRADSLRCVRRYFELEGFVEIDSPVLSGETGSEVHVEPLRSAERYLLSSPELPMKRLLVRGLPRIFQLARCFRAGESGPWHAPEFLMLEWYRAFAGSAEVQADTERLIAELVRAVHGGSSLPLASGRVLDVSRPFPRLSVREAFRRFAGEPDAVRLAERDDDGYFQLLVDAVEPALAALPHPVFVHGYPACQAALARLDPADPSTADRFELYLGGVELCNGYGELNDAREQRERCERDRRLRRERGLPVPDLPLRFLDALERGMPPAGGNALGMDRLIALLAVGSDLDAGLVLARSET